jgi:hypothetical protein
VAQYSAVGRLPNGILSHVPGLPTYRGVVVGEARRKTSKAHTETRRVQCYEIPSRLRNLLRREEGRQVSERGGLNKEGGFGRRGFRTVRAGVKEFVSAASALNH